MVAQKFFSHGHPYKVYKSLHTNATIMFCDIIADNIHLYSTRV